MKNIKVKIFNSVEATEDDINDFIKDKEIVSFHHATTGFGAFNRDSTLIVYKKKARAQ